MAITVAVVLTMCKEERDNIKQEIAPIMDKVLLAWNGGKICGQCKMFNQLGSRNGAKKHTGLNGTCQKIDKRGFTNPNDVACDYFKNKYLQQ